MSRFDRIEFEARKALSSAAEAREERVDVAEQDWVKRAVAARERGDHEDALRLYSRALEWDRSAVAGWVGQVRMLIALEEYSEAELWGRKALESFKNNADLLAGRAQALCRMGNLKDAIGVSDSSLSQQSTTGYPWIVRGEIMLARREKTASHLFEKAIGSDGGWLTCLDIAAVHEFHGRNTQSLIWAKQGVEQAPDQPHGWYVRGRCEAALKMTGAAGVSFRRCLDLMPKHAGARAALRDARIDRPGLSGLFRRLFRG